MDRARARGLGYLACASAAVLWAFGGTFARVLIDRGASVLEITEARAWVATAAFGAIVLARGARPASGRAPVALVVVFGMAIAAANFFYYAAVGELPVAIAIIIQYTAPGLVVLWLALAERRPPSRAVAIALGAALVGVALLAEVPVVLARGRSTLSPAGIAAALASAVAFAVYILTGERLRRSFDAVESLLRGFFVAGAFWLVVQGARGVPRTLLDGSILPGVLVIAVFATIVPFLLFLWGLGHIGASRAGIISTLEPLSAAILAAVWLDQSLSAMQIAGALFVVVGLAVVQGERAPASVPLE